MSISNPLRRILKKSHSGKPKLYNTFDGVFKPTLLTILGAIMYLRVGWVVGNAGLLGGLLIVLGAVSITLSTGLSLSSIATNTRLSAGGPYAMISKALGIEVGGAVGIPLFLSQAFAVAMYIFGFREGWLRIFPQHSALLVDLSIFFVILTITYISAGLAFRVQYLVLASITISLISIFASPDFWQSQQQIVLIGDFPGSIENGFSGIDFWDVFAVFFPAVTGIMSGVNMSGELKNSRKSIPIGTLSAIGVSSVIYLSLCWWAARVASPQELVTNYTIMIDKALWPPAVFAGLLAATFSAGLSSLVGAPRILAALGRDQVIPGGKWISKLSASGEPRRALLITSIVVFSALMIRNLNAIAPLVTMFFLITYATLNLVVLIESRLNLMNFRPTFRIPPIISLYGFVSCLFAMFVIDARFSFIAIVVVLFIYFQLAKQSNTPRFTGDVRSGIFEAIALWAAEKVIQIDSNFRAWRPTLLVPVEHWSQLLGEFRLLLDICQPEGLIQLLGLAKEELMADFAHRLKKLAAAFRRRGIFTTFSLLTVSSEIEGIIIALQASQSTFFRPNILFLKAPKQPQEWEQMQPILAEAQRLEVGIMLFGLHPLAGMGRAEIINLWLKPQLEEDIPFTEKLKRGNFNLTMLMALRLHRSWQGSLHLITVVSCKEEVKLAQQYIEEIRDLCRVPTNAKTFVLVGEFEKSLTQAPQPDMNFIGLPREPSMNFICQMIQLGGSSCLFFRDSGNESAIA